mmetsp:Transcript_91242/g.171915  ORF Transcript_91242/g.171915 Transcript_91242/m.171915 type:complete len:81 (-) Transcript_91242:7-249(-)
MSSAGHVWLTGLSSMHMEIITTTQRASFISLTMGSRSSCLALVSAVKDANDHALLQGGDELRCAAKEGLSCERFAASASS